MTPRERQERELLGLTAPWSAEMTAAIRECALDRVALGCPDDEIRSDETRPLKEEPDGYWVPVLVWLPNEDLP